MSSNPLPGATCTEQGVVYSIWAPLFDRVVVSVSSSDMVRIVPLQKDPEGYHRGLDPQGKPGDAYGYRVNDGEKILPDPASRAQQSDVHGLSLVVDPRSYQWQDQTWKRPTFRDLVIYELHIGTFTPEGTFRSAIARLPYLKDLGINAIEIMPIGDFPGTRNWGYDGVLIYAPARCYGSPDDLRALVDGAHAHGIAVILDVVYNHFGPDGNYVSAFSPHYFHPRHHTPWGNGFNFDGKFNEPVRSFFRQNPIYWMEEFHLDGFRFDATHQIQDDSTPHILSELTETIHARGGYAIAEDERNQARVVTPVGNDGLGFDGVWADDFHHTARVALTQEHQSYFQDFEGTLDQLITTVRDGWFYYGQPSKRNTATPRGTVGRHLPPQRFVHCISNHDQIGNRALGERLNQLVNADAYRALSMLLCFSPYTPMLFMGQEWGAETPFLFFSDHNAELGRKITEGRKKEFAAFPEFADPADRNRLPDPQAWGTFDQSKLRWEEQQGPLHAPLLHLYQECLRLRRLDPAFRPADRASWKINATPWGAGALSFSAHDASSEYLLIFDLTGGHAGLLPTGAKWDLLLSSEESRFGGEDSFTWSSESGHIVLEKPTTLLFSRATS